MALELELHDQVGIVFGGASGIGLAVAKRMLQEGMRVVVADIAPGTGELASALGQGVYGQQVDIRSAVQVQQVVDRALDRWHQLQHVVIAAGTGSGKYGFPFWNLVPGDWGPVLDVNVLGAVQVAHAVQEPLRQGAPSSMLFFASVAAQIGSQTDPPYSAAKAAVLNFAQCAAKDLAPYDVRVNTICPGMVQTPLNRSVWQAWAAQQPESERMDYEAWGIEKVQRVAPLRRWQTVDDVAAMALFLMSPRCRNVTGQAINVDGGQVMH